MMGTREILRVMEKALHENRWGDVEPYWFHLALKLWDGEEVHCSDEDRETAQNLTIDIQKALLESEEE